MKKWNRLFIMVMILLVFTGCRMSSPEEEIFTLFERAAEAERNFEEYGLRKVELEQKEEALYEQIAQRGEGNQYLQSIIEEIKESITERKGLIEKQSQLIKSSYEETAELEALVGGIKNPTVKEKAQQVQALYGKRYEAFMELEGNYLLTIQLEKQLFSDLKDEPQDLENINDMISTINEEFSRNISFQKTFSYLTSQLNDAKRIFYTAAEIPIE